MIEQMIEQCTEMMRHMGDHMTDGHMMGSGMMEHMMGGGMMGGGMMWPMMLGMLLFWTLVVAGIVLLVRLLWNRMDGGKTDPLSILQERFARGEIDIEEYQERRSVLQGR